MAWLVRIDGKALCTEDLTWDELEALERVSGQPWVLLSPVQSVPVAKALLALALTKNGVSDEDAAKRIQPMRLRDLQAPGLFTFAADEADLPTEWAEGFPKAEAAPETTGSSGDGEPAAGRRASRERSASVT